MVVWATTFGTATASEPCVSRFVFSGFLIYNPQENFLQKGILFMDVQLELFNRANGDVISLESVFQAYFACRKNKRRTKSALRFEMNLEENLISLWRDLNNGTYQISRSNAFIVTRPVIREIFAADFRDRIVHHLVIERLLPLLEASFYSDSYSCRKGKGTLYGIRSIYRQLKECSKGFSFIGAFIRPYRLYVGKRLKGCFLKVCTQIVLKKMPIDRHCLSVLNSYLGFLRHYNSFRLRVKGWNILVRGKIKGILTDFYVLKINSCTVSD